MRKPYATIEHVHDTRNPSLCEGRLIIKRPRCAQESQGLTLCISAMPVHIWAPLKDQYACVERGGGGGGKRTTPVHHMAYKRPLSISDPPYSIHGAMTETRGLSWMLIEALVCPLWTSFPCVDEMCHEVMGSTVFWALRGLMRNLF